MGREKEGKEREKDYWEAVSEGDKEREEAAKEKEEKVPKEEKAQGGQERRGWGKEEGGIAHCKLREGRGEWQDRKRGRKGGKGERKEERWNTQVRDGALFWRSNSSDA